MPDILIRDVPAEVIAAVDANAQRVGLSRSEYLRRQIARDAGRPSTKVTMTDLQRFSETFADLNDPEIMARAWE
jgi:hypothetical protein